MLAHHTLWLHSPFLLLDTQTAFRSCTHYNSSLSCTGLGAEDVIYKYCRGRKLRAQHIQAFKIFNFKACLRQHFFKKFARNVFPARNRVVILRNI